MSRTYLAQHFTEAVGLTPKRLARTYRFPAAVRAIDAAGPVDWSEVAHRAGFYHQAHFGNERRAFTGTTPMQYLGVRRRFLREHPGQALDVGPCRRPDHFPRPGGPARVAWPLATQTRRAGGQGGPIRHGVG